MKDIGLENVTVDKTKTDGWTYKGANLTYKNSHGKTKKAILGGYATTLSAKDEKVEIVYADYGMEESYEEIDVKDKLVLVEFDPEHDFWVNYPAYQAKVKGAKAVLIVTVMEEENLTRIGSNDICGPDDAPAFGISQKDSNEIKVAIEKNNGKLDATFNADSKVTKDQGSQNVWGEIPGKTDETILFTAHYDGYYHSYYDDAFGVGTILGIAKAFKDSGYKPEKTLRFITHGAEEWGKSDTEADWAKGAYEQIVNVHPEWAEKAFSLINIDSGYMLEGTESIEVVVPEEFKSYMQGTVNSFVYENYLGIMTDYKGPQTGTEDFVYNAMGIPTLSNESSDGDEKYFASMYHSSMDRLDVGGFADDSYKTMVEFYGHAAISMDKLAVRPMNFESRFIDMADTISSDFVDTTELEAKISEAGIAAKALDEKIINYNESEDVHKEDALKFNKETYIIYKQMQDDLLRLNRWMEPIYPHEECQTNIDYLDKAIIRLKQGNVDKTLYLLYDIENMYYAADFDKETCDYFLNSLEKNLDGTWAENRLVGENCDGGDVVRALLLKEHEENADFTKEIKILEDLMEAQKATLEKEVKAETENLAKITEMMNKLVGE